MEKLVVGTGGTGKGGAGTGKPGKTLPGSRACGKRGSSIKDIAAMGSGIMRNVGRGGIGSRDHGNPAGALQQVSQEPGVWDGGAQELGAAQ